MSSLDDAKTIDAIGTKLMEKCLFEQEYIRLGKTLRDMAVRLRDEEGNAPARGARATTGEIRGCPTPGACSADREVEDLRSTLRWAMGCLSDLDALAAGPRTGEYAEDFAGATRMAWPDDPDQWADDG